MSKKSTIPGPAKSAKVRRAERNRCLTEGKKELAFIEKQIAIGEADIAAAHEAVETLRFQRMLVKGVLEILADT